MLDIEQRMKAWFGIQLHHNICHTIWMLGPSIWSYLSLASITCQKFSKEPIQKDCQFWKKSVFSYWFLLQSDWNRKESGRNQEQIGHIPFGCRGGNKSAKKAVRKKTGRVFAACWLIVELSFLGFFFFWCFITIWKSLLTKRKRDRILNYCFMYFSYGSNGV